MKAIQLRSGLFLAMLFGLGTLTPQTALAHPHVWVSVKTEVVYDAQRAISSFRHQWTFDEAYSSFAILGMDKNNDGKYDREELKELAEVNISSLKEFGYFTFPKLASSTIECLPPRDYWLEYADGKLTLNLTLPLKEPLVSTKAKDFSFSVYDPSYYVDFGLAEKNPVTLIAAPQGCAPAITGGEANSTTIKPAPLGEATFSDPNAASSIAGKYAKTVRIACPAS